MLQDTLFYVAVAGCLLVGAILAFGIGNFGRPGPDAAKRSNRLMRYRLMAQFAVVVIIALAMWSRG